MFNRIEVFFFIVFGFWVGFDDFVWCKVWLILFLYRSVSVENNGDILCIKFFRNIFVNNLCVK